MSNPAALKAAALAAAKLNERLAAKGLTNVKPHSNVKLPASVQASSASSSLMRDIEVNNVPAMIRLEVTRQAFHNQLQSEFGVSVCTKGRYCEPGTSLPDNERPLYLSLWATEPESLTKAVAKVTEKLNSDAGYTHPVNGTHTTTSGGSTAFPTPVTVTVPTGPTAGHTPSAHVHSLRCQEKVFVGMTSMPGFDVVEKLKGPLSSYFSHITQSTGCQVLLRGRGSGFLEPSSGKEAFEAMYMFVSHNTPEELAAAVQLCQGLLDSVKKQYEEYKESQRRPSGGLARGDAYGYTQHINYNSNGYNNGYNEAPQQPPPPRPQHQQYDHRSQPQPPHQSRYPAATYYHPPPPPPPPHVPGPQPASASASAYTHSSSHPPIGYASATHMHAPPTQPPPGPPPPYMPAPQISSPALNARTTLARPTTGPAGPTVLASVNLPPPPPGAPPTRLPLGARALIEPPIPGMTRTSVTRIPTHSPPPPTHNANANATATVSRKRRFQETLSGAANSPSDRLDRAHSREGTRKRRFQERVRTPSPSPPAHARSQSPLPQRHRSLQAHPERPENGNVGGLLSCC